jgi:exodeoxyribonuclease V gamma subunit
MMKVYLSNRLDILVDELASKLRSPVGTPFESERIAVQSAGMRSWLGMELSRRFGIWSNSRLVFPKTLVNELFKTVVGSGVESTDSFSPDVIAWSIMEILPALLGRSEFAPLKAYLTDDPSGAKGYQLGKRIGKAFDEYILYRPGMVLDWQEGEGSDWQPVLFRELVSRLGSDHFASWHRKFMEASQEGRIDEESLPGRLSLFGISMLPPAHLEILAGLPAGIEVNLFVQSPSREYFADIRKKGGKHEQGRREGNPLLASSGRLTRDFQVAMLEVDGDKEVEFLDRYLDSEHPTKNILSTIQSDILNLQVRREGQIDQYDVVAPVLTLSPDDKSISIHVCHSPMREVEVLKDRLLSMFEDRSLGLRPQDVVVLAPDMKRYAPLVEAVFSGGSGDHPAIPYRVTAGGSTADSSVIDALLALLKMPRARMTVQEVFDFLQMDPVRARFELSLSEVEAAREWIIGSGIRWGIDRAHREEQGQPDFHENTWQFGLDRLMIGYALLADGSKMFRGVAPFDRVEGLDAEVLGRLDQFCTVLFDTLAHFRVSRKIPQWKGALQRAVDRLFFANWKNAHQHQIVREALLRLVNTCSDAEFTGEVDLEVVRDALGEYLKEGRPFRGLLGGVNFCDLLPVRSIPFKVVCLLGMNDGDFPRSDIAPGFDLMARSPRPGDRSVRNDDLSMFLESLLAARSRLFISYVGRSVQSNREIPPSVPVSELIDVIDEGYKVDGGAGFAGESVVVHHPLQPFSARYYDGKSPELFSYASRYLEGARVVADAGEEAQGRCFIDSPLPLDADEIRTVSLAELTEFFDMPCAYFVRRLLGVSLPSEADMLDDREPFDLSSLAGYAAGSGILDGMLAGEPIENSMSLLRAQGLLPLGTTGRSAFDRVARMVAPIAAARLDDRWGDRLEPLDLDLVLGSGQDQTRLTGRISDLYEGGRVLCGYVRVNDVKKLRSWISHLALNCAASRTHPETSVLIGRPQKGSDARAQMIVFEPMGSVARPLLEDLLRLYWMGRREPLRFFPGASYEYARAAKGNDGPDRAKDAMARVISKWGDFPEAADPAVRLAFLGVDPLVGDSRRPEAGFAKLSWTVYKPMIDALGAGGDK